jgi:translation initiation factor IF-2
VDEVKAALNGMLAPERKETVIGTVEVRNVFRISEGRHGRRLHGDRRRGEARLVRARAAAASWCITGELDSLKRFKDDVKEVKSGFECGLSVKSFNDIAVGDQLEVFEVTEVARSIA